MCINYHIGDLLIEKGNSGMKFLMGLASIPRDDWDLIRAEDKSLIWGVAVFKHTVILQIFINI